MRNSTTRQSTLTVVDVIRRLRPGDEPTLQDVCSRYKARVPSSGEAERVLALDDVHIWIAEVDGELAGFAYAHELERIDGDTMVFLYELEVDESFRRRGLGRALVEQAQTLAAGRRAFVLTGLDNEPAQRTYAAVGGVATTELVYRF
jgi:GNAT superfamily N-acetyltransferase